MKKLAAERVCIKCGEMITVDSVSIRQRFCKTEDGKTIKLTYCECPKCGEKNVYQIDDEKTLEDLKKITILMGRAMKSNNRDKKKDKMQAKGIDKRMQSRRKELILAERGCPIYERNGEIFIKSLDIACKL